MQEQSGYSGSILWHLLANNAFASTQWSIRVIFTEGFYVGLIHAMIKPTLYVSPAQADNLHTYAPYYGALGYLPVVTPTAEG